MGKIRIKKQDEPSTPKTDYTHIYVDETSERLATKNDDGTVTEYANIDDEAKTQVSSDDTTTGYLEDKIIGGTGVNVSVNNPGGSETIVLSTGSIPLANNVYVSKSGNDSTGDGSITTPFLTIGAAITYINANYTPSSTNGYLIQVSAGNYQESTLALPRFVSLWGTHYRTQIQASNGNIDLITSQGAHTIRDIILYGVTNSSNYCIKAEASQSTRLLIQNVACNPYEVAGSVSNGIYLYATGGTITTEFENVDFDGVSGTCIRSVDNSNVVISGAQVFDCSGATFLSSEGNSIYNINHVDVITALASGINHSSTGQGEINSVNFRNADSPVTKLNNSDILIQASAGSFKDAVITSLEGFKGYFFDEFENEDTFRVLDEMSVGLPGFGKELCVGEGDSYSNGMLVYTYDGTNFTDVSEEAKSSSGSTFTFPSTGATRAIYVTTVRQNGSEYLYHQGIKSSIVTPASSDGEFVAEYWNGSSWVEFNTMNTQSDDNYYPYGKVLFERSGSEQIRYDKSIETLWTKNDPISSGTSYFWVRYRASTIPTTMPIFERWKVHSNRMEINPDGFIEYFGNSRPRLSFDLTGFQAANNSPGNQDLYFQDNFGIGYIENLFVGGAVDQTAKITYLPASVCTSCPLLLKFSFTCTGTDTSQSDWTIRTIINKEGDEIYPTTSAAPTTNPNVVETNVSISPTGQYQRFTLQVEVDISDYIAVNSNGTPDLLGISIMRNGSTDTNSDDIALISADVFYTKANEGGHI